MRNLERPVLSLIVFCTPLRHGQIPLVPLHNPSLFLGDEMVRVLLIPGLVVLILGFGACHADSVTSSIVCDGAAWVSSSVLGQG